jgi:hypothetical protein
VTEVLKDKTFKERIPSLYPVSQEELLAELTSQEAADIQGGVQYALCLKSIEAIQETPGAGSDEAYLTVNGSRVWGRDMDTGDFAIIHNDCSRDYIKFNDIATVSLYEDDSPWSSPDHMGTFIIRGATGGVTTQYMMGSGATYLLTYQVAQLISPF